MERQNVETTGKAFVEHWNWAVEKGLMNKNTAAGLHAACRQVLNIEDGWEELDVSQIDVETFLTRFQNLKGKKFRPKSLDQYKRRFRQALNLYLQYVHDPSGWKPKNSDRPAPRKGNGNGDAEPELRAAVAPKIITTPIPAEAGLVDYPYPLREGRIARLRLPSDLKMIEVRRLTAFMSTLAVDFEPLGEV